MATGSSGASVDVAVVGGGTAGCVVAARLSEDPARRVVLLEAGPDHERRPVQTLAVLHSGADDEGPPDLHVFAAGPFPGRDAAAPFGLVVGMLTPRSRGSVRVAAARPEQPEIRLGHLDDPVDLERMLAGISIARRVARTEPLARLLAGGELAPGAAVPDDDHDALATWIRAHAATYHHPAGICAMGPDPAAGAVVDARGRVHGIDGLYVCDASIMPTIPNAGTHLPTIMVAEQVAAWIRVGS